MKNDLLIYKDKDGNVKVDALFKDETLWMSQKNMSELFGTGIDNINVHLKNIYDEQELDKDSTIEENSIVQKEGNRNVKRNVKFYNLDAIIAVGYRVNSKKATEFRIWATNVLKKYLIKGFVLNDDRFINGNRFAYEYFDELLEII